MSKTGLEVIGSEDKPLSWEEFIKQVEQDIDVAVFSKELAPKQERSKYGKWVYRGHANSEWELLTTLERYLTSNLRKPIKEYRLINYYKTIKTTIPTINTLLGTNYQNFEVNDIQSHLSVTGRPPHYELLCYLRHLGFPSPLLDWTHSFYIAAFFAFRDSYKNQNVSIYAYNEWIGKQPIFFSDEDPIIDGLSSEIETHSRHYRQQSTYTICRSLSTKKSSEKNKPVILNKFEHAIQVNPNNQFLKKFILDYNEKKSVLEKLSMMNINDYTLFGDDESLMRTLAYKAFRGLN